MKHLDERTLALYVLKAPEVKDQRIAIAKHLRACKGCAALRDEISEYYTEFQAMHESQNSTTLPALTPERALQSFFVRQVAVGPAARPGFLQQFAHSFRRYPVRWSTGFATVIAGLVLLTTALRTGDSNPAYARAKEEFLVVYNKHGEELWRRHIGYAYDQLMIGSGDLFHPEQVLTTIDVDGDGANEIIGVFGWFDSPLSHAIVCYRADGTERWKYELHRQMKFGGQTYADDYRFVVMMVSDFNRDGKNEVIAVARHRPSWPNVIVHLDARNGTFMSEYWHSGWIRAAGHQDLDGDGIEELFFAGENNSMNMASFAVFDPRWVEGYGPHKGTSFSLEKEPVGSEKYYLLIPYTDLQQVTTHPRNYVSQFEFKKDGSMELGSIEMIEGTRLQTFFYFDVSMRCIRVLPSDHLVQFHRQLEQEGKIKRSIDENSIERLREGVRYWDGEKFVKEPVMNKRYLEWLSSRMAGRE